MKFCVMPLSGLYRRIFSLPVTERQPDAGDSSLPANCPLGQPNELGHLSERE
jgi:hypothetical protein